MGCPRHCLVGGSRVREGHRPSALHPVELAWAAARLMENLRAGAGAGRGELEGLAFSDSSESRTTPGSMSLFCGDTG